MAPFRVLPALGTVLLAVLAAAAREEVPFVLDWAACKSVMKPCIGAYSALVGDKIKFEFPAGKHSVVRCRDAAAWEACDLSGCEVLSEGEASAGMYVLEVGEGDRGGDVLLACGIFDGAHCRVGQKLDLKVAAEGVTARVAPAGLFDRPSTDPPTPAPTWIPETPISSAVGAIDDSNVELGGAGEGTEEQPGADVGAGAEEGEGGAQAPPLPSTSGGRRAGSGAAAGAAALAIAAGAWAVGAAL